MSQAELPFKDAIENQGRGKNLQRLVVGVWREGRFLTGFNGAGLFKTCTKILCIDNSLYET